MIRKQNCLGCIMSFDKKSPVPGWYAELTNKEYHESGALSSSQLKKLLIQTPNRFYYESTQERGASSAAQNLGSAVHSLVLEPLKFSQEFAETPTKSRTSKEGRNLWEQFETLHGDKTPLNAQQIDYANRMAEALINHDEAAHYLQGSLNEQSVYWRHKDKLEGIAIDVPLKVRPDALSRNRPCIVDIKTSTSAAYSEFSKSLAKFQYCLSSFMYLHGVNQNADLLKACGQNSYSGFVFLVVENTPPFSVAVYELDSEALYTGQRHFEESLIRYTLALENNFPSYPMTTRMIGLPKYAKDLTQL